MRKQHSYYIYITTNPNRKVLYIGVTNNLARRLVEHYANRGQPKTFAGKYYAYNLVYCEHFKYVNEAIAREKELKKWNRGRKEALIASKNPEWKFYNELYCKEWPPKNIWGNYLKKCQERNANKKLKEPIESETSTICIYDDDLEVPTPEIKKAPKTEKVPIIVNKNPIIKTEQIIKNLLQIREDKIWEQSKLSKRELYLVTISLLIALKQYDELATKLEEMPKGLLSNDEVDYLLLHTSLYTGVPTVKKAIEIMKSFSVDDK